MSSKLYLLYSLFDSYYDLTQQKKISHNQLISFYQPFLLYFKNNNKNEKEFVNTYIFDIINIISNIDKYLSEDILYKKNKKYFINTENNQYIMYKKYKNKLNKKFDNMISKLSCLNNKNDNDSLIDLDEEDKILYENSDSEDEEQDIDDVNSENSYIDDSINKEYYICDSFSSNEFYLINKELTSCTCKAYSFCKEDIKTCKHLDYCINNLSKLSKVNFTEDKCNCNEYLQKKSCKHLEYYI